MVDLNLGRLMVKFFVYQLPRRIQISCWLCSKSFTGSESECNHWEDFHRLSHLSDATMALLKHIEEKNSAASAS